MFKLNHARLISVFLLPAAVILMEIFSFYPWLLWLGKSFVPFSITPALSIISCLFLFIISYIVTRFFIGRKWALYKVQLGILAIALLVIVMVIRIEHGYHFDVWDVGWFSYTGTLLLDSLSHMNIILIACLAAIYLWWRGMRRGTSSYYFSNVYRSFLIGLVAIVLLLIVSGIRHSADVPGELMATMGIYIACFFFMGLVSLALVNLESIQQKLLAKAVPGFTFDQRWISFIIASVSFIVLLGILIAGIFTTDIPAVLNQLANIIGDLLFTGLHYLFIPIGYLVALIIYIVRFLIGLTGDRVPLKEQPPDITDIEKQQVIQGLPPEVIVMTKWGIFILAIGLIIFILIKTISRKILTTSKEDIDEVHESLWSWDRFVADLKLFCTTIWQYLKMRRKTLIQTNKNLSKHHFINNSKKISIREIYQQLLIAADHSGVSRKQSETPYEYALRLKSGFPEAEQLISDITNLYIIVRYGNVKTNNEQVDNANNIWNRLKELLWNKSR